MTGYEFCFIVPDTIRAFEVYEKVFGAVAVEKTPFGKGRNEVVFTIYNNRFHMLDENPELGMNAPKDMSGGSTWFNVIVENIQDVFNKAASAGFTTIQPIMEMKEMGIHTSMQIDPWGYVWQLHQIDRVVSFEERLEIYKKNEC
jgi:uncharacterized glyoxalase superfamily protein PhnB